MTQQGMNIAKLVQFCDEKTLCDITIRLVDLHREKTMHVHKVILAASCPYFETMFKSYFCESSAKEISMDVVDVHIAYDIIMSFYGQTINSGSYGKWYYEVLAFIFSRFLGLDCKIDYETLTTQQITDEECALICRYVGTIALDPRLEDLIYHNMPRKYNLQHFDVYQRFASRDKNEYLVISTVHHVYFIDLVSGTMIRCHHLSGCRCICSSPNSNHVAICHYDKTEGDTISIVVLNQGLHISHQFSGFFEFADQSNYSPDNKQFASACDKTIIIRRTSDYEQIKIIAVEREIIYMCYAPDNIMLAGITRFNQSDPDIMIIWDTISGIIKYTLNITELDTLPNNVQFTRRTARFLDSQQIIIRDTHGLLKIWDITKNTCVRCLHHAPNGITPMYSLAHKNQIITNQLEIIDIDTGIVVDKLPYKTIIEEICLTPDNKLFVLSNVSCHIWDWTSQNFSSINLPSIPEPCLRIGYGCEKLNSYKNQ